MRGCKGVLETMTIEAQHQNRMGGKEGNTEVVIVRVGVLPKDGDRPLLDLAENGIKLSLEQAREFDEMLRNEIAAAEMLKNEIAAAVAGKMAKEAF